jgi:hypothetical protein
VFFDSRFRYLIDSSIRCKLALGKVVFESQHDSGGHFASHEKPELLVQDVRNMFGKKGPAFGIVPGKTGYA